MMADRSRRQLDKFDILELPLPPSIVQFTNTVSELGVMETASWIVFAHATATCRSCMFQLRQLRAVRHSYPRTRRRRWSAHSSAVDSTTATAYWPVSLMVWWQNCSPFRMQQCDSSPSPESSTTSRPYFASCIRHWLPSTCWFQGGGTRPQVSARSRATVSHRRLHTSIFVVWSAVTYDLQTLSR